MYKCTHTRLHCVAAAIVVWLVHVQWFKRDGRRKYECRCPARDEFLAFTAEGDDEDVDAAVRVRPALLARTLTRCVCVTYSLTHPQNA